MFPRVCRVCLHAEIKMHSIHGTQLQYLFEMLANNKFNTESGRPEMLCFICYSRLKSCHKLMMASRNAEDILTQVLSKGLMCTPENVAMVGGCPLVAPFEIQPVSLCNVTSDVEVEFSYGGVMKEDENEFTKKTASTKIQEELKGYHEKINIFISPNNIKEEKVIVDQHFKTRKRIRNGSLKKHKTAGLLRSHKIDVSKNIEGRRYSCSVCDKKFVCNRNLKKHITIHNRRPDTYSCECGKAFFEKTALRKHMRIHVGAKPFACDTCDKKFPAKSKLNRHIRTHTEEKPYTCDVCKKSFAESGTLKSHKRTHTGEKPYSCESCGTSFAQSTGLRTHLLKHTGQKLCSCDICHKSFTSNTNLKIHKRIHSGDRPYSCDLCGKSFAQSTSLKKHFITHTGERRFSCIICDKRFTAKNSLSIHLRIHSGIRPYACDVCNKPFYDSSTLKRHKMTHSGDAPYSCVGCKKTFSKKSYLKQHLQSCKR